MANYQNSIIQGNTFEALQGLPDAIFDCGVTSPPYNKKEKNNGWLVKNVVYDEFKDVVPEEEYQQNQINVLNELYRLTKEGGHFFYNHKTRWERGIMTHPISWIAKTDWLVRQEIIWDRTIAANIRGWRFWQVDERIYWLYKPHANKPIGDELKSNHALMTSIWRFPPEQKSPHPAPFPLALPTRCIYAVLDKNEGANIIDPYCGSGTTLLAAKLLGHNYCGIDISNNYIELAEKRLADMSAKELKVFEEECAKHKVIKTFKQRKEDGVYDKRLLNKNKDNDLFELR